MATDWLWIALPSPWTLQDVQAGLNVYLSVLCAMCIFVFSRMCWQSATAKVVQNRPVPLPALLSVTSLGEVYDVVRLLGWTLLSLGYLRILAQCLIVIGFMAGAVLSGPVARYSTRHGQTLKNVSTPGYIASRSFLAMAYASVLWNETESRLNAAGFPQDQLLDFYPNNTIPWQYVPGEWNSSWSMSCQKVERTPLVLSVTNTNCSSAAFPRGQIPGLLPVFNGDDFEKGLTGWDSSWESRSVGNVNVDVLWFLAGWSLTPRDAEVMSRNINVTTVSLHMQKVPLANQTNMTESNCYFGHGPVGSATYIKTVCEINRNPPAGNDPTWNYSAMPDRTSTEFHVQAYTSYYQARFNSESITGRNVTELTPDDLIRFYQVYQITKDTQAQLPVYRNMTVAIDVVDLSTILIIVSGTLALLCLIGFLRFSYFWVRNYNTADQTPLSRLDWMLHAVEQTRPVNPSSRSTARYSVTSFHQDSASTYSGFQDDSKKAGFESARYGLPAQLVTEPMPYRNSWITSPPTNVTSPNVGYELVNSPPAASPGSAAQTPFQHQGGFFDRSNWDAHSTDTVSLLSYHPTAPADPLFNNEWPRRS